MTKEEFVRGAYAAAAKSSERSGMPAMVTVAQAALESNWGKSRLSQEAHNYFGIKAHGKHERIRMCTRECAAGKTVELKAEFAKYPSLADCIECRDELLLRGAVYAGAREARGDEERFVREMAKHWATDPKYAEKLLAMLVVVRGMLRPSTPKTGAPGTPVETAKRCGEVRRLQLLMRCWRQTLGSAAVFCTRDLTACHFRSEFSHSFWHPASSAIQR